MTDILSARDEEAALEELHRLGCKDGLPVVIPTAERVSRMVLASGLDADMMLGTMGPGHGIATVEKVAIAAVMAGCTQLMLVNGGMQISRPARICHVPVGTEPRGVRWQRLRRRSGDCIHGGQ